jgi:hypothetical protein
LIFSAGGRHKNQKGDEGRGEDKGAASLGIHHTTVFREWNERGSGRCPTVAQAYIFSHSSHEINDFIAIDVRKISAAGKILPIESPQRSAPSGLPAMNPSWLERPPIANKPYLNLPLPKPHADCVDLGGFASPRRPRISANAAPPGRATFPKRTAIRVTVSLAIALAGYYYEKECLAMRTADVAGGTFSNSEFLSP